MTVKPVVLTVKLELPWSGVRSVTANLDDIVVAIENATKKVSTNIVLKSVSVTK